MKEFIKKYSLIIFLVVMIIILAFVKSFFGNNSNKNETKIESVDNNTSTSISNDTNNTEPSGLVTNTNEPNSEDETNNAEEIKNSDETFEKLDNKYESFENVDEREAWVDSLSPEDQELLSGEEVVTLSQLNNELPYEGTTFILKSVSSNDLLGVKSKIDDLDKAESDLRDWLSSKGMNFDDLVVAWEE